MIKSGLYDSLSYILDSYSARSNGLRVDEYCRPEVKDKFGCYSPDIVITDKGDYIEISFKGSFHYYLDFKDEKYTIRVNENDKVKHNLPFSRRELLNKITNYLQTELYQSTQQYNQAKQLEEIERKLRDMRRDPNFYRYKEMAKEIAFNLGTVYRSDDINDYNAPVTQDCSYDGYGLRIVAYDLPGYVFENDHGGLSDFIKDYMDKIRIRYKGKEVFDSADDTCINGIWEDVLTELYGKLDVLVRQKENRYQTREHCNELMKKVVMPLYYQNVRKINDSLKIGYYTEESTRVNNCGSYETDYHYYVSKDNEKVLHVVESGVSNYSVYSYKPGYWEHELKDYLAELEVRKLEKAHSDGLNYIEQLRRLR